MPQGVRQEVRVRSVLMTTDPVLLSFARTVLEDAGISAMVADQFTSAIEGSVGIFPRRLMVPSDAWDQARAALTEAGLARELVPDPGGGTGAGDPET
jgi:Putative prokaryotic signal transducing protein